MAQFPVQFRPTDQPLILDIPSGELWSDEPPLESDLHREQIDLLIRLVKYHWRNRSDFYVSGNLTVYYNEKQLTTRDFRGPDFFLVLDTDNRDRKSWVVWKEQGRYPNLIVELLSDFTAKVDRGLKKQLYQDVFRTPYYFWFHPNTLELAGFELVQGVYQPLEPDDRGHLWCAPLGLALGVLPEPIDPLTQPETQSSKQRLRLFTDTGDLVLLPEEAERQRAEAEHQRAEAAEARLAELLAQLDSPPDEY
ncbi:MAG: Uma2 family endonuclease [Prochlorothrix sp.]|nr:Uma2 family endonuclease [Prochlorothrix sp.]